MCEHNAHLRAAANASSVPADVEDSQLLVPPHFEFSPMFQHAHPVSVEYEQLDDAVVGKDAVKTIEVHGRRILEITPGVLSALAHRAMGDIQHFFRHDHLSGWARALNDPEASANDRFVALQLLKNACVASQMALPACQDTGTAIVFAKRGENVWGTGHDEEELARGIWEVYTKHNLRYSQCAPVDMFNEVNTNNNMPAQVDIMAVPASSEYQFLFIAKGGGSANKALLFQQTKALLNPKSLRTFVEEKLRGLGTSACPPYHIALVIGGTSAEMVMKTVKLASCRYYDDLPTTGDASGRAFRDLEWEGIMMKIASELGVGAQFGGKYFAHQCRVIRLPRHGASCPVGLGVSCSADRQILAKITSEGVFVEKLVRDPSKYLPKEESIPHAPASEAVVRIDLRQPMDAIRAELSKHPIKTRLSLSGPIVVARDIAHAKLMERLDAGQPLPQYIKDHIVYYAGPAKTPAGMVSGSFGPTTAGRMDSYLAPFMAAGGSFVTLAKGNRSKAVTQACQKYKGFYLGSIGGPAALLAQDSIRRVEVLEYPELGMEAVWFIDVADFPAFIVVDDKGNDFYAPFA